MENNTMNEENVVSNPMIVKYKKPLFMNRSVRKWMYSPIVIPKQQHELILKHWAPQNKVNDDLHPFSKLDKHVDIIEFDKNQYTSNNMSVNNWTYEETQLLMRICKKYELKFYVVQDRYNQQIVEEGRFKTRSVEELKQRFYYVDRILRKNVKKEPIDTLPPVYDLQHEIRRKQLLKQYYSRTVDEIAEESYLVNELKRIKNKQREMDKVRVDTTELLHIADDIIKKRTQREDVNEKGSHKHNKADGNDNKNHNSSNTSNPSNTSISNTSRKKISNVSSTKKKKLKTSSNVSIDTQKRSASNANLPVTLSSNKSAGMGSRTRVVEAFKNPGVHVRSQKMIVTHNIGMKRIKMLEQVCIDLGLDTYPPPTEEIFGMLVDLRSQILCLFDLKNTLGIALYDLQMIRHKSSNDNIETGILSDNCSGRADSFNLQDNQKSFSSVLDSMVTTAVSYQRKRKASLNKSIQS